MRKIILFLCLSLYWSGIFAQAFQWAVQGGGAGSNSTSDKGEAVATDSQGNVIITGIFEGTAQFGTQSLTSAGSNDIFVAKYDTEGNIIWAVKAGGTQLDWAKAICTDKNDNIIITGQFSGTATFGTSTTLTASSTDIFTAKYNSNGVLQWAKKEGGSSVDRGLAVAADTSGNIIVTGDFSGSVSFGSTNLTSAGAADVFLLKYNAAGNVQWAKKAGNTVNDRACAVTTDPAGNIYIAGSFGGTVTFGTTTLTATGGSNDTDIFTAKYDAAGNVVWAKKGGSNSIVVEEARGIAIDNSQNIYVTGLFGGSCTFGGQNITSAGGSDAFLAKYNNSGDIQWAAAGGGTQDDEGTAVAVAPNGKITITGFYKGSATFGTATVSAFGGTTDFDAFAAHYTNTGSLTWLKSLGRVNEDKAAGIKISIAGQQYLTGFFRNNILFDQIQLNAQGYSDAFLVQLNDFISLDTLTSHNWCAGDQMPVDYTTTVSFNTSNVFKVWLSDAAGSFANPVNIGTLTAQTSGTVITTLPDTLSGGTAYRIKIDASAFPAISPVYYTGITIDAKPAMPQLLSQAGICLGDTLGDVQAFGQNVNWYSDLALTNLIFNGNALAINEALYNDTTFYCVSQSTAGCMSDMATITIAVYPLPVITNNLSDTTLLCLNGTPFNTIITPAGGTFSGIGTMPDSTAFYPALSGTGLHEITYSFTDTNNCTSTYNLYFDVVAPPTVTIDTTAQFPVNQGDTVLLTGIPSGGTFSGPGMVNGYFVAYDTIACTPCTIWYVYEDANGCSDSASVAIVMVGINDKSVTGSGFEVYPNPAVNDLWVKLDKTAPTFLRLYDIQGRLISEMETENTPLIKLDVHTLAPGLYLLSVQCEKYRGYVKVLKY